MLKKICPNCEKEYVSLDIVKCDNCESEVYPYLTEDKGISKIKSALSSNKKEEKRLIEQLESLFKWDKFFNNMEFPKSYNNDFFISASNFKKESKQYDFPETIIIENDEYKIYLRNFYNALEFIFKLDQFLDNVNSYNINNKFILDKLRDENIDLNSKKEFVKDILFKIEKINNLDCFYLLDSYEDNFKTIINDFRNVNDLVSDINKEINIINELNKDLPIFKKYFSGFSNVPKNFQEFKKKLNSLKYLDIIPYFNQNIDVDKFLDMKETFNLYDEEIKKVNQLNNEISNFYNDFDNLIEDIVDDYTKHKFLDKYSDFKDDLFSFKYLKLLDNVDEIKQAQKFFNNFDNEWNELVVKKTKLDEEKSFNEEFEIFDDKWSSFDFDLSNQELYKQLSIFRNEVNSLKKRYPDFIKQDQFSNYSQFFNYIEKLNKEIDSLDFGNFKVSILLNYLNDASVNETSKIERLNSYKILLEKLDSMDLEALEIFNDFLEIPYSDISEMKKLFFDVNEEILQLNNFKVIVDKYNNDKIFPEDINFLENEISKFKYLDIIPYFDYNFKSDVETLSDFKNYVKQSEIEKNKITSIILDCSKCKLEFENVNNGKMNLDDFLNKYLYLKEEILSFKYLDLLYSSNPNLKDFIDVVRDVQEIFRNS